MSDETKWSLVIESKRKLLDIPLREIIRYRDLLFLFVKRDFVIQYKQTVLGPLWFVINPLLSTVMYTFVFGNLANIATDGIPHLLFYYSGTMLWNFFSGVFNDSSNVFINNAGIFGKVYFPRLIVPINYVLSNVIKLFIQFLLLMVFLIYFSVTLPAIETSLYAVLFPFLVVWLSAVAVGAGIIVSSLTTKYRDLRNLVSFALGLLMYATPVVYPLSQIPAKFSWVAYINPVSAPIELFRRWFFGTSTVNNTMIFSSIIASVFLLIAGLILFNQNERNFIDVV